MPSGLAEQSPIYKHKVSDTLAAASGDSLKFPARAAQPRRKSTSRIVFPCAEISSYSMWMIRSSAMWLCMNRSSPR